MDAGHTPPVARNVLSYNPTRIDYTVSDNELKILSEAGQNYAKDFFIALLPLSFACILNGINDTTNPINLTVALFLNYLIGGIGILMSIYFGIIWRKTVVDTSQVVESIKSKPLFDLTVTSGSEAELVRFPPAG